MVSIFCSVDLLVIHQTCWLESAGAGDVQQSQAAGICVECVELCCVVLK